MRMILKQIVTALLLVVLLLLFLLPAAMARDKARKIEDTQRAVAVSVGTLLTQCSEQPRFSPAQATLPRVLP